MSSNHNLLNTTSFGTSPSTTPCIHFGSYHRLRCNHWVHTAAPTFCAENCRQPCPDTHAQEHSQPFFCEECAMEMIELWPDIVHAKTKAEWVTSELGNALPKETRRQLLEKQRGLWRAYDFMKKENIKELRRKAIHETHGDTFSPSQWSDYDFAVKDLEEDAFVRTGTFADIKRKEQQAAEEQRALGPFAMFKEMEQPAAPAPVTQASWQDRSPSPGMNSEDDEDRGLLEACYCGGHQPADEPVIECENADKWCEGCASYDNDCLACQEARCPVGWYHATCVVEDKPGQDDTWVCSKCIEREGRGAPAAQITTKDEGKKKTHDEGEHRRSEREVMGDAPAQLGLDLKGLVEGIEKLWN